MKITRRQLRQVINEEIANLHEAGNVDIIDVSSKAMKLVSEATLTLNKAKDENVAKIGRILMKIGEMETVNAVYKKDNAALKAQLDTIKSYIDAVSQG